MAATTAELFPGAAREDALTKQREAALAACLVVGRSLAGSGGNRWRAMVELLRQCRKLADLVDGSTP